MIEIFHSPGFMGTSANFAADMTLVFVILIALVFSLGFYLARIKKYEIHRWVQTIGVLLNTLLVLWLMILPFRDFIMRDIGGPRPNYFYQITTIHAIIDAIAFPFGLFVVLRGNNLVPKPMRFSSTFAKVLISIPSLFIATIISTNTAGKHHVSTIRTEETPIPQPTSALNLPLVFAPQAMTPVPPPVQTRRVLFCSSPDLGIPDNYPEGVSHLMTIAEEGYIHDIDVRLDISHTWVSDLSVDLKHEESGMTIRLIDRPGLPGNDSGCGDNHIAAILDDQTSLPVENECASYPQAISGIYLPEESLRIFNNLIANSTWRLTVSDNYPADIGQLNQWCLSLALADQPWQPELPPPTPDLPNRALISGVTGRSQALPLDCESRSAVDWAHYFGVNIDELEFFHRLPESKNPDEGFVGSVYGAWGQIPPAPYGVHAEPVADLLRQYGLPAYAHRPLSWDEVRAEIAQGNPVIAWIVGTHNQYGYDYVVNGIPEYYLPSENSLTIVARYEHTIIITGYTPTTVTYLNGGGIYEKSLKQFLESWSALNNMVITTKP